MSCVVAAGRQIPGIFVARPSLERSSASRGRRLVRRPSARRRRLGTSTNSSGTEYGNVPIAGAGISGGAATGHDAGQEGAGVTTAEAATNDEEPFTSIPVIDISVRAMPKQRPRLESQRTTRFFQSLIVTNRIYDE